MASSRPRLMVTTVEIVTEEAEKVVLEASTSKFEVESNTKRIEDEKEAILRPVGEMLNETIQKEEENKTSN